MVFKTLLGGQTKKPIHKSAKLQALSDAELLKQPHVKIVLHECKELKAMDVTGTRYVFSFNYYFF